MKYTVEFVKLASELLKMKYGSYLDTQRAPKVPLVKPCWAQGAEMEVILYTKTNINSIQNIH